MFSVAGKTIFVGIILTLVSLSSAAATVTQNGDTVSFTYETNTQFGTGFVVGDAIFFLPDDFKAESLDGAGTDTNTEILAIIVEVLDLGSGNEIDSVFLEEKGDYFLNGANSTVRANGQLMVSSLTSSFNDSVLFNAGTLNVMDELTDWEASANIELNATPEWESDTKLVVSIQNNLTAVTDLVDGNSEALIFKKRGLIGLSVGQPPQFVPVPAAVWLFGSGLLGLIGIAKRRKTT